MAENAVRPLRLGVVGIGKIARDQHLPAIAASPLVSLVATASPNDGVDGVPRFADVQAMLRDGPPLDAISICTPPVGRETIAFAAIAAGKHVMMEKPPGTTVSSVSALTARAHVAKVTLFAAWHSRETAAVDAARAWLSDRQVDAVEIVWKEDIRVWHPDQAWIMGAGGFGVFDPGINALSIATMIIPGMLVVEDAMLSVPANQSSPIAATIRMRHDEVAPVTVALDFLHVGQPCWDITVRSGASLLTLTEGGAKLVIDGKIQALSPSAGEYPRLYDRFAAMAWAGASEVDIRPLQLVSDAFMIGHRIAAPAFSF